MTRFKILAALGAATLLSLSGAVQAQVVRLSTNLGDIRIQLEPEKAPKTVANFLQYVKTGHYNGVIFHRVIDGFMIQTGGYTPKLAQKPTRAPIPLEAGLPNIRSSVAMARTADPNSATAQFFINVADNIGLDPANAADGRGYAVFGHVIEGMAVVDQIRAVPTVAQGMFQNLPAQPILINKASVENKP